MKIKLLVYVGRERKRLSISEDNSTACCCNILVNAALIIETLGTSPTVQCLLMSMKDNIVICKSDRINNLSL